MEGWIMYVTPHPDEFKAEGHLLDEATLPWKEPCVAAEYWEETWYLSYARAQMEGRSYCMVLPGSD